MTKNKEIQNRHDAAVKRLKRVAAPKIKKHGFFNCALQVGRNLDLSYQTIINYHNGKSKDGYITEAIIKEFQSI